EQPCTWFRIRPHKPPGRVLENGSVPKVAGRRCRWRDLQVAPIANNDGPLTRLRDSEERRIEDAFPDAIPLLCLLEHLLEQAVVENTGNVFHEKERRLERFHDPEIVAKKPIALVFFIPLPRGAKALARRATEDP